jgi:phage-related protein
MADFPTLTVYPTYPLDEQREDATIRSAFEAGYEHTRPRFTRNRYTWVVKYNMMPSADKTTLEAFVTTVREGADKFSWTNPVDSAAHTVTFSQIPKYSCTLQTEDDAYFDCDFQLRSV